MDRVCEQPASLISDSIGVSFPVSYNSDFPFLIWYFLSIVCLTCVENLVSSWPCYEISIRVAIVL